MTRLFKRGEASERNNEDGRNEFTGAPGDYVIAMTWFERRQGKSGADYLRCAFTVAAGPHRGESFFCAVSLAVDKIGARRRLELWMESVGMDDEIDLDADRDIARAFRGKAFKATLSRKESHGSDGREWINYDIERTVYPRLYSDRDLAAVAEWNAEWASKWQQTDPQSSGRRETGGGSAFDPVGEDEQPAWSGGSALRPDDYIPF